MDLQTWFINFTVYHINEKPLRVHGFGGSRLKYRDVCMDLEPRSTSIAWLVFN